MVKQSYLLCILWKKKFRGNKGKGKGWITAEYAMLPTATHTRTDREAIKGKTFWEDSEIQRLIGRSIRNVCKLDLLGEKSLKIGL